MQLVVTTFSNQYMLKTKYVDILLNLAYCWISGFEKPSAIQQRSIKPIIKGRDVIAQAQSGTGKTATFSISILQSLDTTLRDTQVLTLSPTRELAVQIQKVRSVKHLVLNTYNQLVMIDIALFKAHTFSIQLNKNRFHTSSTEFCLCRIKSSLNV